MGSFLSWDSGIFLKLSQKSPQQPFPHVSLTTRDRLLCPSLDQSWEGEWVPMIGTDEA